MQLIVGSVFTFWIILLVAVLLKRVFPCWDLMLTSFFVQASCVSIVFLQGSCISVCFLSLPFFRMSRMIKDGWEYRLSFLIWMVGDSGCFSHRRILVINPWRRYEPPHHWPNPTPTQNDDWVLNVALVLYSVCYRWWHGDQRFRGLAGTISIFVLWWV